MKALLIEFDLSTGKRAGNISPKDANLACNGWQDLESKPAKEIRLIKDNRDTKRYEGIPGITVLDGKEAINIAIDENIPIKYNINNKEIFMESMKEKKKSFSSLAGKEISKEAKQLYDNGVAGISKIKPQKIE